MHTFLSVHHPIAMLLLLLSITSTSAFFIPSRGIEVAPRTQNLASFAYALDFATPATVSTLQCMKNAGYQAVFVRAYNPAGNGAFDRNAVTNVNNAFTAQIGAEVFMTPQPVSSKTPATQMDEVIDGLISSSITIRSIWIQVTSPLNWATNTAGNTNFVSALISRAKARGLAVGIYTNIYDWSQITNNWQGAPSDVMLWYWNVLGPGVSGETGTNFADFRAFGNFRSATAKQFAQVESVCGTTVNRDIFPISTTRARFASPQQPSLKGPSVGGIIGF